jgi:phage baseplate assembly protein V
MQLKSMIRVGVVSDRDPVRCAVRVIFPDQDEMVSGWLPLVVLQARETKEFALPDIDETVVCIFLGSGIEKGYCIGAIYTSDREPPTSNGDERGVWFPDGSHVVFDRAAGMLVVNAMGNVSVTAPSTTITGNVTINGSLDVSGSITRGGEPV